MMQFNFERVEIQTMKNIALFTFWLFTSVLISSIFATNQDESSTNWNRNNVQDELKKWLKNIQTSHQSEIKNLPSIELSKISCYDQNDVLVIFDDSDDTKERSSVDKKQHVQNMADLHAKSGRIFFKDQRKLKASNFNHGLADGIGKITLPKSSKDQFGPHAYNASFLEGNFENGCLHGLTKGFEYAPQDGVKGDPSYEEPILDFIAVYKNGYPISNLWKIIISPDGVILGYFYIEEPKIDAAPNLGIELKRQKNVVFLYPDLLNGIRGQFDNQGILIAGHRGRVVGEKSSEISGIKEILFKEDEKMVKSDVATKTHLSSTPYERDPYEKTLVDVKKSTIKNAGNGTFSIAPINAHTTIAYFNGIHLSKSDVFSWNPFKKNSVYLVEVEGENGETGFLDIPSEFASWSAYQASAGHKVNHGSKNANVGYTDCVHPIFGKILCLYSMKDIPEGTELFTRYEVALDQDGMKKALKVALELGHRYTGKSRSEFASQVRPYLKMAAQFADQIDVDTILSFK